LDLVSEDLFTPAKLALIDQKKFPFIHVELFEQLQINGNNLEIHKEKENVYSLGLIVLYIASLFDFKGLYYNEREFKEDGVEFNHYYPEVEGADMRFNFSKSREINEQGEYNVESEHIQK
jgi:hypothetical protein